MRKLCEKLAIKRSYYVDGAKVSHRMTYYGLRLFGDILALITFGHYASGMDFEYIGDPKNKPY